MLIFQVTDKEKDELGESIVVKSVAIYPMTTRVVTHNDLDSDHIALAIKKICYVVREYGQDNAVNGVCL